MHRTRTESAAVTVEAALATPLVVLLLLGLVYGALLMRAHLAATYGAEAGARSGSVGAVDQRVDYDVLKAVAKGSSALGPSDVVQIIVYKASSEKDSPPPQCEHGAGIPNTCNVYTTADMSRPMSDFSPTGWAGNSYWTPAQRLDPGPNAYIGVAVTVRCDWDPVDFGVQQLVERSSVMGIERSSY